jgi:hypothetical protein
VWPHLIQKRPEKPDEKDDCAQKFDHDYFAGEKKTVQVEWLFAAEPETQ